ncbi:hypothetical protein KVR01_003388 [Diaporthe batatas]|uniref:uncharacterized protein n=1 Tax=Diaporthe batatas TaxID=748121 RepID=UPI001D05B0B4|nr:uncharacterized protein KVR01_003388 [Diaporthe batatas]KAG8167699.1 hypothetical protein KVR01_003388 [Diaporthe batatas]
MLSYTCLLSLPVLALARDQKANASSVANPVHGNLEIPIGALTSAWTHPPHCGKANDTEVCVFTNSYFGNGQGISILADAKDMAEIDWIERFAEASNQDAITRTEGIRAALIPGKGMGMVSDRVIGKGEIVMSSVPHVVEHDAAHHIDPNTLSELRDIAVERMGKEQQTMFLAQHRQWGGHHASDIMITNSFLFKGFGGLPGGSNANFPEVSKRFNHACRPNMGYTFDAETLTQSLVAVRTIHPGDELTITSIESMLLHEEENLTGYPLAAAFYMVKAAAEAHGIQSLATKYGQMAIIEQYGERYEEAMVPEDRHAKDQETQDGTEERGRNQNGKDETDDEGHPQEELDLGPAQAVMHQVGEATINSPM